MTKTHLTIPTKKCHKHDHWGKVKDITANESREWTVKLPKAGTLHRHHSNAVHKRSRNSTSRSRGNPHGSTDFSATRQQLKEGTAGLEIEYNLIVERRETRQSTFERNLDDMQSTEKSFRQDPDAYQYKLHSVGENDTPKPPPKDEVATESNPSSNDDSLDELSSFGGISNDNKQDSKQNDEDNSKPVMFPFLSRVGYYESLNKSKNKFVSLLLQLSDHDMKNLQNQFDYYENLRKSNKINVCTTARGVKLNNTNGLNTNSRKFEALSGVTIDQFIEIIVYHTNIANYYSNKYELMFAIYNIFDTIDVNTNFLMDWDEFTSYLVDAVHERIENTNHAISNIDNSRLARNLAATMNNNTQDNNNNNNNNNNINGNGISESLLMDIQRPRYQSSSIYDMSLFPSNIFKLKYINDIDIIVAFEVKSRVFKIYDQELKLIKQVRGHRGMLLDCIGLPDFDLLATSSADGTISFWDIKSFQLNKEMQNNINNGNIDFMNDGTLTHGPISIDTTAMANLGLTDLYPSGSNIGKTHTKGIGSHTADLALESLETLDLRSIDNFHHDNTNNVKNKTKNKNNKNLKNNFSKNKNKSKSKNKRNDNNNDEYFQMVKQWELDKPTLCMAVIGSILFCANSMGTIVASSIGSTGEIKYELAYHQNCIMKLLAIEEANILVSSSLDADVAVWDTVLGTCKNLLKSHESGVLHLAYYAKNDILCTAGQDSYVLLWHLGIQSLATATDESSDSQNNDSQLNNDNARSNEPNNSNTDNKQHKNSTVKGKNKYVPAVIELKYYYKISRRSGTDHSNAIVGIEMVPNTTELIICDSHSVFRVFCLKYQTTLQTWFGGNGLVQPINTKSDANSSAQQHAHKSTQNSTNNNNTNHNTNNGMGNNPNNDGSAFFGTDINQNETKSPFQLHKTQNVKKLKKSKSSFSVIPNKAKLAQIVNQYQKQSQKKLFGKYGSKQNRTSVRDLLQTNSVTASGGNSSNADGMGPEVDTSNTDALENNLTPVCSFCVTKDVNNGENGPLIASNGSLIRFERITDGRKDSRIPIISAMFDYYTLKIITVSSNRAQLWDALTGRFIIEFDCSIARTLAESTDSTLASTIDPNGDENQTQSNSNNVNKGRIVVTAVCFDSYCKRLYAGTDCGTINCFNVKSGECLGSLQKQYNEITQLKYCHRSNVIVSTTVNGIFTIHSDDTDKHTGSIVETKNDHQCEISVLKLSSKLDLFATGDVNGRVFIYQLSNARHNTAICSMHQSPITAIEFVVSHKPSIYSIRSQNNEKDNSIDIHSTSRKMAGRSYRCDSNSIPCFISCDETGLLILWAATSVAGHKALENSHGHESQTLRGNLLFIMQFAWYNCYHYDATICALYSVESLKTHLESLRLQSIKRLDAMNSDINVSKKDKENDSQNTTDDSDSAASLHSYLNALDPDDGLQDNSNKNVSPALTTIHYDENKHQLWTGDMNGTLASWDIEKALNYVQINANQSIGAIKRSLQASTVTIKSMDTKNVIFEKAEVTVPESCFPKLLAWGDDAFGDGISGIQFISHITDISNDCSDYQLKHNNTASNALNSSSNKNSKNNVSKVLSSPTPSTNRSNRSNSSRQNEYDAPKMNIILENEDYITNIQNELFDNIPVKTAEMMQKEVELYQTNKLGSYLLSFSLDGTLKIFDIQSSTKIECVATITPQVDKKIPKDEWYRHHIESENDPTKAHDKNNKISEYRFALDITSYEHQLSSLIQMFEKKQNWTLSQIKQNNLFHLTQLQDYSSILNDKMLIHKKLTSKEKYDTVCILKNNQKLNKNFSSLSITSNPRSNIMHFSTTQTSLNDGMNDNSKKSAIKRQMSSSQSMPYLMKNSNQSMSNQTLQPRQSIQPKRRSMIEVDNLGDTMIAVGERTLYLDENQRSSLQQLDAAIKYFDENVNYKYRTTDTSIQDEIRHII